MMIILFYIYNQKHGGSCFGAVAAPHIFKKWKLLWLLYCSGPCHDLRQTMSNFQIILIDAMNLAHSSQELVVLLMGQARLSRFWLVIQQNDLMKKKIATNFVNFLKSFLIYRMKKIRLRLNEILCILRFQKSYQHL